MSRTLAPVCPALLWSVPASQHGPGGQEVLAWHHHYPQRYTMSGTPIDSLFGQDGVTAEAMHLHSYLCATLEVCPVSSLRNARGDLETAKLKAQGDVCVINSYVIYKVW